MRQQRSHTQLGVTGQAGQRRDQLRIKAIFTADQALQLFPHLVAEAIGDQHAHLALALQIGTHKAGEEQGLADHRSRLPSLAGIDELLPAHIETRQVIVGVKVFDLVV